MKEKEKKTALRILSNEGNLIQFVPANKLFYFGHILKEARLKKKINQGKMAEMMGVSRYSILNWESNKSKPDIDQLPRLCSILDISIKDLFGFTSDLSPLEKSILEDVKLMNHSSQRTVKAIVNAILDAELKKQDEEIVNTTKIIPLEPSGIAAGAASSGVEFSDSKPTPFFVIINNKTRNADAVVRVKGHSMEPDYDDGDLVLFEFTNIARHDDDVVLRWGNAAFVKRIDSNGQPYSVNPDPQYEFIYEGDGSDIEVIGKVIGIVSGEDVPDTDKNIINELLQDEIKNFNREHGIEE